MVALRVNRNHHSPAGGQHRPLFFAQEYPPCQTAMGLNPSVGAGHTPRAPAPPTAHSSQGVAGAAPPNPGNGHRQGPTKRKTISTTARRGGRLTPRALAPPATHSSRGVAGAVRPGPPPIPSICMTNAIALRRAGPMCPAYRRLLLHPIAGAPLCSARLSNYSPAWRSGPGAPASPLSQ